MKTLLCFLASLLVSLSAAAQFVNFADADAPVSIEGFLQLDGQSTNLITADPNPASLTNNATVHFAGAFSGLAIWLDVHDDDYAFQNDLVAQAAIGISNFTGADVILPANTRLGVDGLHALDGGSLTSEFTFTYVNDGTAIIVEDPTLDGVILVSHYDALTGSFYFTNPAPLTIPNGGIVVVNGRFNTTSPSVATPEITSPANASGTYGSSFSYTITADNTPTSFSIESGPLPAGVTLNTGTGVISGTPTETGTFNVTVGATNSAGSDTQAVAIAIATKALSVSGLSASDKTYNGGSGATITGTPTLVGVIGGDTVTLVGTPVGTFTDADARENKTVTVSGLSLDGASAGNYSLPSPTLTADIWTKTLTVAGLSANDKIYDGTTTASITGSGTLSGVVGGDTVTLNGTATGAFSSASVGTAKTVTISGLSLGGGSADNYDLTAPTTTANITAATVVPVVTLSNKSYDGTTAANIASRALTGVLLSDVGGVALSGGAAVFADPAVGAGKTVTITGLTLTGPAAGNYQLSSTTATATADITGINSVIVLSDLIQIYDGAAKAVTVTTSPANLSTHVTYDGNPTAPTSPGSYAVVATVTTDGYSGSATGTLIIAKAAPVITWPKPAAITAGTPLSSTQLNATADVPGTFVYSPAAGTVLNTGADQTLNCTFTPSDTDHYTIVFGTTTLTVNELRIGPKITSPERTTFTIGIDCAFTVAATGAPAPTFSASGLPSWAALDTATGVIQGTPPDGTGAAFAVTLIASNGAGPDATQNFTLKVEPPPAATSPFTIATLAGQAQTPGSADAAGASARFNSPLGMVVDNAGNFYVADTDNHVVRKITMTGMATTFAGQPGVFGRADGAAGTATFHAPTGVAFDNAGNLYVADTLNHTIRKITPTGVVTTLAGQPGEAGSADGTGASARFRGPEAVAFDGLQRIYVADTLNHTIRAIDLTTGEVSTAAGLAGEAGSADGPASVVRFNHPSGLGINLGDSLYIADSGNNAIRRMGSDRRVTTLAGLAGSRGAADGIGSDARFNAPSALVADGVLLYVTDTDNHTIRKLDVRTNGVTTIAGSAGSPGSVDSIGAAARFDSPSGIAWSNLFDALVIADTANHTLRKGEQAVAVTIVVQPQSRQTTTGKAVTFNVSARGNPTPTFQWYHNGEAIPGATADTYSPPVNSAGYAGAYTVVVSNALGSVTSDAAMLSFSHGATFGGAGGGAPSAWFYFALAAAAVARAWTTRNRAGQARRE